MCGVTISEEPARTSPAVRSGTRRVILVAGVLALANLVVLSVSLGEVLAYYHRHETTDYVVSQDIWFPFCVAAWAQAVVNGLLLLTWKRSRGVGFGVLLGALAAALLFVAWVALVLAPALGD